MSEEKKIFFAKLQPFLDVLQENMNNVGEGEEIPLFYEPIHYVLQLPGKRIRPLLTILSALTCGGELEQAIYPAAAVELLHNFTLVHDDIMDNDATRRGQPTVHEKWDVGTAILAGDGLMGLAFQKLLRSSSGHLLRMTRRFADVMLIICEGQGLDKMFEQQSRVSYDRYLEMIRRKTAVLIELACELGGLSAEASEAQIGALRNFGHALGMAFQVQDDWLDTMADEQTLGKHVGSDYRQHKQTILTILLKQRSSVNLEKLSFEEFKQALIESSVADEVRNLFNSYYDAALKALKSLPQNQHRNLLEELTLLIKNRHW